MATARTIDAAISATLASAEEVLRGEGEGVARRAVAEERFADLAVDQLLKTTADSLMERASWSGYQSVSVARQLVERVRVNFFRWGPSWSRCVADAALVIAERSDHATPALLFEAQRWRMNGLLFTGRFEEAFRSIDRAEALAADTHHARLRYAIAAHLRATAFCEMTRWREALAWVKEAQEQFRECEATRLIELTWGCEGMAFLGLHRFDEARALFNRGLDSAAKSGDHKSVAHHLQNIGATFAVMGDAEAARLYLNRAGELCASLSLRMSLAKILEALGCLDITERGVDGRRRLDEATAEFERLGMDSDWVDSRVDLAEALVAVDPSADVTGICQEAYERAIALGLDSYAERALALLEPANAQRADANTPM
jgi:tetratricopeptide (TPR) repeat protein